MMMRTLGLLAFLFSAGTALADDATVAQNQYFFSGKEASALIATSIANNGSAGTGDIKAVINGTRDEDSLATASAPLSAEVTGLTVDAASKSWQATLFFTTNGKNLPPVRLAGRYDEITQIPVLKRRLQSGDIISESDIDWVSEPTSHIHKNTVTDAKDLVGKSPKRMISENRPVRTDEVANAAIIAKGAHITLFFKSYNLEIKTIGEALDNGAKGDVIRVRNLASKAIVDGRVESADRVRVGGTEDMSASAEIVP